jgi:glycolate oxidase
VERDVDRCLAAIARTIADDCVITDPDVRAAHARDESELEGTMPDAVIRPRNARDVAVVVREAAAHRVPVTARGAGTGKAGGAVPLRGGIVLATDRLRAIAGIEREDGIAIVEPGVTTGALHAAVEAEGYFWAPDPNSLEQCTIGGNVACNASGPRSFKYGATREWVVGLEIVTGEGAATFVGRRTRKGASGYDLASLIVGSEGTLAIVTRAFLRLEPAPERVITLLVWLPSVAAVAPAIAAVLARRIVPRCVELLDDETLALMRAGSLIAAPAEARALLVVELDAREAEGGLAQLEREALAIGEALASLTPFDPLVADSTPSRERFWAIRREMSRTLRRSARFKRSEDVIVPRSRIGELIARCRQIAERHGIRMPAYGHAGDGNLHINLLWDDPAQAEAVDRATGELFEAAVALGGSVSGEHGVGALKARWLPLEHSPERLALQRAIKSVFDPCGILNPGKVLSGA